MTDLLCLNSIRGKSGKDTLISLLESEGRKVFRVAFADVLKEMCAQVLAGGPGELAAQYQKEMHKSIKDKPRHELSTAQIAPSSYRAWSDASGNRDDVFTPRSLRWHLQNFGTGYHREHLGEPDVWFDLGMKEVRQALEDSSFDHVVVTDMRMPNEYKGLSRHPYNKRKFGTTIRIVREWFIPGVDDQPYHISDIALMAHPFDALVVNRLGEPWAMLDQLKEQGVIK